MSTKLLMLAGALLLTAAQAQATTQPASTAEELLKRITSVYGPGAQVKTEVLLGTAPADLRASLPPGSRVIGTVSYSGSVDGTSSTSVYLETRLTPEEVVAHFAKTLGAKWKRVNTDLSNPYAVQGGFQPSEIESNASFYRQTLPEIIGMSFQVVNGVTQVNLNQQKDRDAERAIGYLNTAPPPISPDFVVLPKLKAPADSIVTLSGGGNGGDNVTQNAQIGTKLNRQAVMDYYAAQLRQAGWSLTTRAEVPNATTTVWTYKQGGRERIGVLIFTGISPYPATLLSQRVR